MDVTRIVLPAQTLFAQAGTGGEFTGRDLDRLITNGKLFTEVNHTAWEYVNNNLMKTRNQPGYISDGQIKEIKIQLVEAALSSSEVTDATKERYRPYLRGNNDRSLVLGVAFPTPGYLKIGIKGDDSTPTIACSGDDPPIREVKRGLAPPEFGF